MIILGFGEVGWATDGMGSSIYPFGLAACEMDSCAPLIPHPEIYTFVRMNRFAWLGRGGRRAVRNLSAAEAGEAVMR
jgi:hypothetical protein